MPNSLYIFFLLLHLSAFIAANSCHEYCFPEYGYCLPVNNLTDVQCVCKIGRYGRRCEKEYKTFTVQDSFTSAFPLLNDECEQLVAKHTAEQIQQMSVEEKVRICGCNYGVAPPSCLAFNSTSTLACQEHQVVVYVSAPTENSTTNEYSQQCVCNPVHFMNAMECNQCSNSYVGRDCKQLKVDYNIYLSLASLYPFSFVISLVAMVFLGIDLLAHTRKCIRGGEDMQQPAATYMSIIILVMIMGSVCMQMANHVIRSLRYAMEAVMFSGKVMEALVGTNSFLNAYQLKLTIDAVYVLVCCWYFLVRQSLNLKKSSGLNPWVTALAILLFIAGWIAFTVVTVLALTILAGKVISGAINGFLALYLVVSGIFLLVVGFVMYIIVRGAKSNVSALSMKFIRFLVLIEGALFLGAFLSIPVIFMTGSVRELALYLIDLLTVLSRLLFAALFWETKVISKFLCCCIVHKRGKTNEKDIKAETPVDTK